VALTYTVTTRIPRLSRLQVKPRFFQAATKGRAIVDRIENGTTITYRDTLAAHTALRVYHEVRGVKRGRKFVAPPGPKPKQRSNGKPCTRLMLVGSCKHHDNVGTDRLRFTGWIDGRALSPGRTNWIPGLSPGHVGPPPGGAPGRTAGTGGLLATAE